MVRKAVYTPIYAAVYLALCSASVWAQTTQELSEINVKGKAVHSGETMQGGSRDVLSDDGDSLGGHELKSRRAVSLGQTVESVAGVQNSSFGPNNGLPQIRSLTGPRVFVSENGLGVGDLAAVSGNLPVAVQPFLADKITVYKSSAAVLFGGNAVGGAVDVRNGRIPDKLPEKPIGGKFEVSGGSNTPHTELFSLDGRGGSNFAWHLEGINSQISHYRVPNYSKAGVCRDRDEMADNTPLREQCQVEAEFSYPFDKRLYRYVMTNYLERGEEWRDMMELGRDEVYSNAAWRANSYGWSANPDYDSNILPGSLRVLKSLTDLSPDERGKMTNSHLRNRSVSFGAGYIGERGYLGAAVSRYTSRYGVPGYAAVTSRWGREIGMQPANIEAAQTRISVEGVYRPQLAWLDNIKAQAAYTDAKNSEYLGSYFSGSLNSRSLRSRVEANHRYGKFWRGTFGLDWMQRRTDGSGEDRYLPDTKTHEFGLFALEKFTRQHWEADLGWRFGQVRHQALLGGYKPHSGSLNAGYIGRLNRLKYSVNSSHAALTWKPADILRLNLRYSRSQRAPSINEVFAGNRHFAILTNEQGDPRLRPETAVTWELGGELNLLNTQIRAAYYRTDFKDYLYLAHTGFDKGDRMPYKEWRQADTRIDGIETELRQQFELGRYGLLEARLFADWVKNYPKKRPAAVEPNHPDWNDYVRYHNEGAYMPNLPTSRYGVGLAWQKSGWQMSSSLTRYQAQKHLAKNINSEIGLGGYTLWDAYVSYTQKIGSSMSAEWFADGRNLTNAEARPNNSILKYLAPLPGRSVRIGVRLVF